MENLVEVYLSGKTSEATGIYDLEKGTLKILKGSKISVETATSLKSSPYYKARKDAEEDDNITVNGYYVNDYEYNSPSAAGSIILGSPTSGPEKWKTKEGLTINNLLHRRELFKYLEQNATLEKNKEYIEICENGINKFNSMFPISDLINMPIEKYDKQGSRDSFMYTIEKGTNDILSGHLGNNRNKLFYQVKTGEYESIQHIENQNPDMSVEERFEIYKSKLFNSIVDFDETDYLENSDSYYLKGANIIYTKLLTFYRPGSVLLLASLRVFKEIFEYLGLKGHEEDSIRANILLKQFLYKNINPNTNIYALSVSIWNYYVKNIQGTNDLLIEDNSVVETVSDLSEVFISNEKIEEILNILERKKNLIFQGVPGVGKTYSIKRILKSKYKINNDNYSLIQFHQSYSYEEFIEGLRPQMDGSYTVENGVFKDFVIKAKNNPNEEYFFIIDEINRGNLSKIFGELLMLIENDKREKEKVILPYSKEEFSIPSNLFIIGTMNTADRSLSLVDYALRRRFSFITLKPSFCTDKFNNYMINVLDYNEEEVDIINKIMNNINSKIISKLGENFVIGHSYFIIKKEDNFNVYLKQVFRYEILPTIEEYFFDDEDTINELKSDMGI